MSLPGRFQNIVILFIITGVFLISCQKEEPSYLIGVSNTLSGLSSPAGNNSRNGIQLFTEEINAAGGINGRLLDLIILDDQGTFEGSLKANYTLIESGVTAIIGSSLSTPGRALLDLANEHHITAIATAASSDAFSGQEDYFFSMFLFLDKQAPLEAQIARDELGLDSMAIAYNMINPIYTQSHARFFNEAFQAEGAEVPLSLSFHSEKDFNAHEIASRLVESGADGVFLITNGLSGALIVQNIKHLDPNFVIFDSGWGSLTSEFINMSGSAGNGVYMVSSFDSDSQKPEYLKFRESYRKRFSEEPSMYSLLGYEAMMLLKEALELDPEAEHLNKALLEINPFHGLMADMEIDENGDLLRPVYLFKIKDRAYELVRPYLP